MRIFSVIISSFLLQSLLANGQNGIDWGNQQVGSPPKSGENFLISGGNNPDDILIVSKTTDPINELESSEIALRVFNNLANKGTGGQLRLWWRISPDKSQKKGVLLLPFRLSQGGLILSIGQNQQLFNPQVPSSMQLLDRDSIFLVMRLIAWEPIMVICGGVQNYQTEDAAAVHVQADKDYLLRVVWDFEKDKPGFELFLNNEPFLPMGQGEGNFIPISAEQAERGIDSLALSAMHSMDSSFYLGPIQVDEK